MSVHITRKLIDIGANLTDPKFRLDFQHMLKRAKDNSVHKMIITGGNLEESKEAIRIARQNENGFLFSTVGCHPTRCDEFVGWKGGPDGYLSELENLIVTNKDKVVALGEMGLDYDRLHFCTKETQKEYFEKQLLLAKRTQLPLFLHNRNSIDDFIDILQRNKDKFSSNGGVVHSFDGTASDLDRILQLGLYIGINGCSLKTEENLQVAKLIPSDKLMIETDCPWCEIKRTHAGYKHVNTIFEKSKKGTNVQAFVKDRNEPASLIQVIEVLSTIRGENIEQLCEQVYDNTNKLFFK